MEEVVRLLNDLIIDGESDGWSVQRWSGGLWAIIQPDGKVWATLRPTVYTLNGQVRVRYSGSVGLRPLRSFSVPVPDAVLLAFAQSAF